MFVVLSYPVALATINASRVMFGRDQGIYQFVAWALFRGARDYVDVCDINGPLTHGVHQLLLLLGGSDEHTFRVLDLLFTGASFAFTGACLPDAISNERPRMKERLAWAAAAWAFLSVQYLSYSYWDISQRESFCDWMLFPSVVLQLSAMKHAELGERSRLRVVLLMIAGALSLLPWFIKPSYVVFTALQAAMLVAAGAPGTRKASLFAFASGALLGLGLELAWIFEFASLPGVIRGYFWEAPLLYGPIWHVKPLDLLRRTGFPNWSLYAGLNLALFGWLVYKRLLARRLLLFGLLPAAAVLHVLAQGKGFEYHYHPLTGGLFLAALTLAYVAVKREFPPEKHRLGVGVRALASGALLFIAATRLLTLPYLGGRARVLEGNSFDRPRYELRGHFIYMRFYPWDLGRAARYVQRVTKPGDRLFLYGTSPYLLFLAERDTATCDLYPHQLNVDAAIDGRSPAQVYEPGERLDEDRANELRRVRDRNARTMFAALQQRPPAALVFTDMEAFLSDPDSWRDFERQNPEPARWLAERYVEVARFGTTRVWLPRSRVEQPSSSPGGT